MANKNLKILVTGGSGFIGSALIRHLMTNTAHSVLNLDCLTYAGNEASLQPIVGSDRYHFSKVNICDQDKVAVAIDNFRPDIITHLAAESHVDRSIEGPKAFIETNIVGTFNMLNCALRYWQSLEGTKREKFRFHHISTDEVFGSLGQDGAFTESSSYDPRSPYSASKASSDHLVRSWFHTYGLPILLTNCSNNYGPYQFPEKLIPLMIIKCLSGESLPVYGAGSNVRDWLYVDDHVRALEKVFEKASPGESYMIGGQSEVTNLSVVKTICRYLNKIAPRLDGLSYSEQIDFVADRPGHDHRYAVDFSKIKAELDWRPEEDFESGMEKTIRWYLNNASWWQEIQSGNYRGERLGISSN